MGYDRSEAQPAAPPLPWWSGPESEFSRIRAARSELHRRNMQLRRGAWWTLVASLSASVSIYSTHAVGALAGTSDVIATPVSVLLVLGSVVWVLDRRLVQQVEDAQLHGQLWHALVAAARKSRIDSRQLVPRAGESEVDRLLRAEAALAVRLVTSGEPLSAHVPLLAETIRLRRRPTD